MQASTACHSSARPCHPSDVHETATADLLLRHVVLGSDIVDVEIRDNRISSIGVALPCSAHDTIDARGTLAAAPPFYNAHTHAAMTLLRGYAEDVDLSTWLTEHIWPAEARLTPSDVYAGARLAILEMIKSGTVFFNDMYWDAQATLQAAVDMGVRAELGLVYITRADGRPHPRSVEANRYLREAAVDAPSRITFSHAPHAPYSVSEATLRQVAAEADVTGWRIHTHVAETAEEVRNSLRTTGMTPVAYLDSLGLVRQSSILAHCVHIDDSDRTIISDREAVIAHMAGSNLKLRSGFFEHERAEAAGCRIVLGTDGAASNNSLSMIDEMKLAALLAKSQGDSPRAGRAADMVSAATAASARAFGIDAGRIEVGALADVVLLDLRHPTMSARYDSTADLVYAADSSVVDTVICDGRVLMRHRSVPGEDDIISEARAVCEKIAARRRTTSAAR